MADVNLAGWGWYEKCQVPSLTAWCERLMGPSKLVGKRSIGMCLFVCGSWMFMDHGKRLGKLDPRFSKFL